MLRAATAGLFLTTGICLTQSCTLSTVKPPATVADPAQVYIVDYPGLHVGLILSTGSDDLVEYAFGEWDWYALGRTSAWRIPSALFVPTAATLGRRNLIAADFAALKEQLPGALLYRLVVDSAKLQALLEQLAERYREGGPTTYHPYHDLHFASDHDSYHLFHLCSDEVAVWLRLLDCEVTPAFIRLGFATVPPDR